MRVRPGTSWPGGRIERLEHRSEILRDNPWGDPSVRELCVYLPPDYDESGAPLIALWDLAAFTNAGPGHLNWRHHGENLPQRLDRLIAQQDIPQVIVAMPDCFTSLGGNQYVDSPAVGNYASYLVEELVPLLSRHFNVGSEACDRGVFGKSSGGYGALTLAMRYPALLGAVAAHAADCGFEWVYRPEFPLAATRLQMAGGDYDKFLSQFWRARKRGKPDYAALLVLAMAATYDPDPEKPQALRLPFRLHDCEMLEQRWERWLEHDPLNMVEKHADALAGLHELYIDVGSHDKYNIQYGTRKLTAKLEKLGVDHHFEEFEGGHLGLDWRLDFSLPLITEGLAGARAARGNTDD
ncbi:MAG: hypothetical protein HKO64_08265 [Xanthomonadales bacterium]|nr:hypothetical protein [Xanthomonadales bacterium]